MSEKGKVWKGRFRTGPDPEFEVFSRSVDFDIRLAPYELTVDRVWCRALENVGVYTREEREQVERALDELAEEWRAGRLQPLPEDEDVHTFIERLLSERLGDVGEKIHTGRSRNDLVITDLKLYLRDHLTDLADAVTAVQAHLRERARESVDVLLPAYTHLQRAQPVSLAHYLLSCFWALQRPVEAIRHWLLTHNTCPLGSGACSGSGFPIDRRSVAQELGFDAPTPNSLDAVASRDFVIDAAHVCAGVMLVLSRYAEDWILWSSAEFRFVELSEPLTTGSSLMPQKRNPDSLELIRGKAARVIAAEERLWLLAKGLPLTYNRDLQEDKEPIFDALDQTIASLRIFGKAVAGARWNADRLQAAIEPALMATDLADYLVRKGVPFREAHRLVGRMVLHAEETGRSLDQWSVDDFRHFCPEIEADVMKWLKPEFSVSRRNLEGGTGPEAVRAQLGRAEQVLAENRSLVEKYRALHVVVSNANRREGRDAR